MYGGDGRLMIEIFEDLSSPLHYSIYSIDGEVMDQGWLTTSLSIQIKSGGVYIVCIGNTIHKILL